VDIKGEKVNIYHTDYLEQYLKEHSHIKIALLSVPEHAAQGTLDRLVSYGMLGIVNFAPKILKLPKKAKDVQLVNDCIGASLYKIVYQIYHRK
jgi:NADH/NAD ratio-sensing transcriptional regulator Rex